MKYVYDIEFGHYVLNEDDNNQTQSNLGSQSGQEQTSAQNTVYKSVQTDPTIIQLTKSLNDKQIQVERELTTLNTQLNTAKQAASKGELKNDSSYDPSEVDSNILSIQNKILTKQNEFNIFANNVNKRILARKKELSTQKQVAEYMSFGMNREKARILAESKIAKCKVYLDGLVNEEGIHDRNSLNRCFKDTNLIYGKERKGNRYFVVLIDQEDTEELYQALLDFGYDMEEVQTVIISQLMDRSHMV